MSSYIARTYQKKAVKDILEHFKVSNKPALAVLPTGCHALNYEVLDYKGCNIKVQNIKIGDQLMGPDSKPRKVLKLHRGVEQMYNITLRNKLSFEVNGGHLLQLYRTNRSPENKGNYDKTYPPVLSVSVNEYIKWAKSRKHLYKIKRAGFINYTETFDDLTIDPYFLGVWLGDGTNRELSVTTEDTEIKEYLYNYAKLFDLKITINTSASKTCPTYYLTKGRGKSNKLRDWFIELNLFNNKHIPKNYLKGTKDTRFRLLEGLIDTDGSLDKFKGRYEISFSNKQLANDTYTLCCSLGLQPSINKRKTTHKDSYRISFRWCSDLKPKLKRKKLNNYNFQSNGDMYSFNIKPTKIDRYYGFTLNEDHLYIDTHNIIHHNSGKSWVIADLIQQMGNPSTIVFQPKEELLKQNYEKYTGPEIQGEASLYSASVGIKEIGNVTYVTPGSVKGIAHKFKHVKLVIIDEAHIGTTPRKTGKQTKLSMIIKFIKGLPKDVKVIGLTATPLILKNYSNASGFFSQLNIITRISPRFWSKIIHVTQVKELYDNNYLSPLRFTTFDFGMRNVKTKGSDFDLEEVAKLNKKKDVIPFAIKVINESIKRGKKKILVFTPTVGEAYDLKKAIPGLEVISSGTKKDDRSAIVKDFVEGDLKVLANYGTLTTGFDAPEIDLIVCLRPTQSYALYYQLMGRGIRIAPGKLLCDVVDLSGNYKEFGDPKDLIFEESDDIGGWGMFVKEHLMSGIPIGQKIRKSNLDVQNQKVNFGKYKGMAYKDIPTSYLEWVRDNFDLNNPWAKKNIVKPLKQLGIL